jgi:hypothetical protein
MNMEVEATGEDKAERVGSAGVNCRLRELATALQVLVVKISKRGNQQCRSI